MVHVRRQIREKIHHLLTDGTTPSVSEFLLQRRLPLDRDLQSVGLVFSTTEESSSLTIDQVQLERVMTIMVAGHFKGEDSTLDGLADDFAEQAELILAADRSLGGLAQDVELQSTQFQSDNGGEISLLAIILEYRVAYITLATDPTTAS